MLLGRVRRALGDNQGAAFSFALCVCASSAVSLLFDMALDRFESLLCPLTQKRILWVLLSRLQV